MILFRKCTESQSLIILAWHLPRNYDENNFHLIIKHNQKYNINSYFISVPTEIRRCNKASFYQVI